MKEIIDLDREAEFQGVKVKDMPTDHLLALTKVFRRLEGEEAEAWCEVMTREVQRR